MKISTLLVAGACMGSALCAQQTPVPSLKTTTANLARPPFSGDYSLEWKPACDRAGNVYTSPYDAATTASWKRMTQLPVEEVSPSGKPIGNFHITDVFPDGVSRGFTVGPDGGIYQIAVTNRDRDHYVVEYAPDGSVKAKTKLQTVPGVRITLVHLAIFKSGEYLLVGTSAGQHGHYTDPYTAVFAADGRLVKELREPEDEEAGRKAEMGDIDYAPDRAGNHFVSLGDVTAADDGNAYILRRTPRGVLSLIYVVSPKGEVVRKLRIDPGDSDLMPRSIRSHGQRLAIGYGSRTQAGPFLIKVVDFEGSPVKDYSVVDSNQSFVGDEGLDIACYDSEGVTLTPDNFGSKSYMLRVQLH